MDEQRKKLLKVYAKTTEPEELFVDTIEKIEKVEQLVKDIKIPEAINGITPIKGKDYFDGEPGKTPTQTELLEMIKPLIPPAIPGMDGNQITPEEVAEKIKEMKGKKGQVSVFDLADVEWLKSKEGMQWSSAGFKIYTDSTLTGDGTFGNPLSAKISAENNKVAISATDTTPDFLVAKLLAGSNVTITKENAGANEDLKISVDLSAYSTKAVADTLYYPLSTNPAGYLTSSALSGYVPYSNATTDLDLNAKSFKNFFISKTADTTAKFTFDVGNLSTATIRTLTVPNRSLTLDNITTSTTSNGTGFIKSNGTSITFDNSTYLTSLAGALLADGTVTGATSQAQVFTLGVTASTLTAGRVTFAGTAGLLSDDPNFVWDNTNKYLGLGVTPSERLDIFGSQGFHGMSTAGTPTGALAGAGAGVLGNGNYKYKVGFYNAKGDATLSAASANVAVVDYTTNGKIVVTFATSTDLGVTGRKIYRTAVGGSTYYLLATIANNTATTYTDNIADATLITQGLAPIFDTSAGWILKDTTKTALYTATANWNSRLMLGDNAIQSYGGNYALEINDNSGGSGFYQMIMTGRDAQGSGGFVLRNSAGTYGDFKLFGPSFSISTKTTNSGNAAYANAYAVSNYNGQGIHFGFGNFTAAFSLKGASGTPAYQYGLGVVNPVDTLSFLSGATRTITGDYHNTINNAGNDVVLRAGGSTQGQISTATIATAGTGYTAGDVLSLAAAVDGVSRATFTVGTVDGSGAILTFAVTTAGSKYLVGSTYFCSGGTGTGASFTISAVVRATDKNGGNLYLYGGLSSGTGSSNVYIGGSPAGATGSGANASEYHLITYGKNTNGWVAVYGTQTNADEMLSLYSSTYGSSAGAKALTWRDTTNIVAQIDTRYNTGGNGNVDMYFGHQYKSGYQTSDLMVLKGSGDLGLLGGNFTASGYVKAASYYVGATAGASGTFTTVDLKTVTVTNGIITSII